MHKNQLEHDRSYRDRQRDAGNVKVCVMVPADRAEELKAIAKAMRDGKP